MDKLFTKPEQNVFKLVNKIVKYIYLYVYIEFDGAKPPIRIMEVTKMKIIDASTVKGTTVKSGCCYCTSHCSEYSPSSYPQATAGPILAHIGGKNCWY